MVARSVDFAPNLGAFVACLCLYATGILADRDVQSDEISLEREQISVYVVAGGPTFSLMVEPDETVWDLRRDIYEHEGIPYHHMQPKIDDALPDYDRKLSDYNLRAGATLGLEIFEYQHRYTAKFIVRTRDGRELPLTTQLGISVASLKMNITQLAGIPQAEQRLLLRGKELRDERKLVHYDIGTGTVLNLGRPLEDCQQVAMISVRTLSGARIEVEVNLADTVAGLKEKIWVKTGVPASVQHLRANERVIVGQDHLCDLGLEAGSTVFLYLYSARITSLDQVARLREPPRVAPIFREAEDMTELAPSGRRSLFKDERNWVARSGPRSDWDADPFDPIARLEPDPDDKNWAQKCRLNRLTLSLLSRPEASEWERQRAATFRARIYLSTAVRPFRVAANLTSQEHPRQHPGIALGGGFTGVSPEQVVVPLGADVNNWAPDAFSDPDVGRLFEVAERVRQVLARAAQTGEGILSIADQRRINNEILFAYVAALAAPADVLRAAEYHHTSGDDVCGICIDELAAEPAIKLTCEHAFHTDCILTWVADLYQEGRFPSCPFCRQSFLIPYEILGRAVLETPEMRRDQDE